MRKGLSVNYDICKLDEQYISDTIAIFNQFFSGNSKIIYVVDHCDRLMGIITVKVFLECLKNGKGELEYYNQNAAVLYEKEESLLFQEAESLLERLHITTAIPVVDGQNNIIYEVLCHCEAEQDKGIIEGYHEKFARYLKSYYMKDEIAILRKVLHGQKVTVIGGQREFEQIFGPVFRMEDNLVFLEDGVSDGYGFLKDRSELVIDLTIAEHVGRNDIYAICNNGYGWKSFWNVLLTHLERGHMSAMYRLLEQRKDIFKSCLKKYFKKLYIQTNSFMVSWLITILRQIFTDLELKKELFRSECFRAEIFINGIVGEYEYATITGFCHKIDAMVQFAGLYHQYKDKVTIINYACDSDLDFTDTEKQRCQSVVEAWRFLDDLKEGRSEDGIYDMCQKPVTYFASTPWSIGFWQKRSFENDVVLFADCCQELVHIENGMRKTCGQPQEYMATIYMFGVCTMLGAYVEDKDTIPSLIQKKINLLDKKYRVVNLGNMIGVDYERLVKKLKLKPEDIFVILYPIVAEEIERTVPIIEIGNQVNRLRKEKYPGKDIFIDLAAHCGEYGSIIYAECIWDKLQNHLADGQGNCKNRIFDLFRTDTTDLNTLYDFELYLSELGCVKSQIPESAKTIGSIVMNCNPFTKGHRYLVETALKQVDYLIVFVVEEDKSFFTFGDRYEMARQATKDLHNMGIIRSGKSIASDATFTEYFQRSSGQAQRITISTTYDLVVFAKYIVPFLGITKRFIAEEPIDRVTRQYNEDMKKVLPEFGVDVVEIRRMAAADGEIISASKVREMYAVREFEKMKEVLPESTYEYLVKHADNYVRFT